MREKLIIDPGFGAGSFGKNLQQNLQILKRLKALTYLKLPLLVGLSYKTFISEVLDIPLRQRLPGVLAATVLAIERGANIIRTHDIKETQQVVKMVQTINKL